MPKIIDVEHGPLCFCSECLPEGRDTPKVDLFAEKEACVACEGTGKSSRGRECVPCHGSGEQRCRE